MRRLLLSVVAAAVPLAAMVAPGTANAATTAACTGGLVVSRFAFHPSSVPSGSSSALTLVLRNCAGHAIQGSTTWFGHYTGHACPVLDPVNYSYAMAALGAYKHTSSYGDSGLPGCSATALTITANVNVNGAGTVATVSATVRFRPPCAGAIAVNGAPAATAP